MPADIVKTIPTYPTPKEVDYHQLGYEHEIRIKELKEELKHEEEELKYCMEKIVESGQSSKIYVVTDLLPRRRTKAAWFREHMPDVYNQLAKLSATKAVELISENLGGEREFQLHLRSSFESGFVENATIAVGELEGLIGKKTVKGLQNEAVETYHIVSKKTHIIRINEPYELTEGEDTE